ncbi:MAG TPA: hypothetical protein VFV35_00240 [Acidimicrobiales bacterium]|nr:hypothetical protein [Acidimicrobiales bacterium]
MSGSPSGKTPDDPAVVAAIVAAVDAAWPRPVIVDQVPAVPSWRFSNRWWMPRRAPAASRPRP